jgi:hypothetical protein
MWYIDILTYDASTVSSVAVLPKNIDWWCAKFGRNMSQQDAEIQQNLLRFKYISEIFIFKQLPKFENSDVFLNGQKG